MKAEPINKGIPIHGHRPISSLSPKKDLDGTEFQPILDKELDKLNASGSIYNIENPKIVLAGILGIINGVKTVTEDNPSCGREYKSFGFDKIQHLIEDALRDTVIRTGRGQLR